jgi:EAL domain-containing protein (putative c-di-GMP-specific phosphodiesterase class I)
VDGDLAREGQQQLIELARAIDDEKTGAHYGPQDHGPAPCLIQRDALQVLGERQLASLILSAAFEEGEHADVPNVLLQRADAALAHARSHHSGIEVYSPECDHFDATRLRLLAEISGALGRGEFVLQYQPQIELQSGRITGVEALVRWHHPLHGVLAPPEFIPLIEQTALIRPLTLALIDQALGQLVTWRGLGIDVQMSVNLSARNLLDAELPQRVVEILDRHRVRPDRLIVEVTESAAMADPRRAVAVLAALRATGIGVSVDDFGTGNASIEYLAKLPASEIKIDRSFITDILEDPRAEAIVRSTIDLARNLGLTVVAEGIETEAVCWLFI